ncbi:hypothetical protein FIU85_05885 [Roseovarius sp. THAF8]|uniref:hypothetical protein n=1 Tax=Roseovarius sp. THAF8 TaxID=2587846 RepID=UPI0012688662|nr:hypothetical protein [Roseovarius sp. THAF8]QFT96822.1 hypothetical protein FIU85_05885 [Roseovarius sp. THAF8]
MTAKSMEKLEKDAEEHRTGLADAIGDFADTVNPARLGRQTVHDVAEYGRSATHSIAQSAKDHPVGLALVGIGAAMLVAGGTAHQKGALPNLRRNSELSQDERIARAADRNAKRAQVAVGRASPSSSRMRRMLDSGLDRLGPEARDRVISMRLKAVDAQEAAERYARGAAKSAVDTHNSQPLVTGLVAAGIGGLLGALLPSTRREAEIMGARRDAFLRAAEERLSAEIAELETRGKAAVNEAVRAGSEQFQTKAG